MEHLKRPTYSALGMLLVSLLLLNGLKLVPSVATSSLWPTAYLVLAIVAGVALLAACALLIFRAVVIYPGLRVPTTWRYLALLSGAILLPSASIALNVYMLRVMDKLIIAAEEMAEFGPSDAKHIESFLKITEIPRDRLIETSQGLGSHFYIFRGEIIEVMGTAGQREWYKPNDEDRATRSLYLKALHGLNARKISYLVELSTITIAVIASFIFGVVYRRRYPQPAHPPAAI